MTKLLRISALAATAALIAATPAVAAPVGPQGNTNAKASARIVKPLTLTWVQDLDLGTILLSGAAPWSGAVVSIAADGTFTCTNGNVVCSGATSVAKYHVTGTNNQRVFITSDDVVLTNVNDGSQLTLTMASDNPAFVDLANSGAAGMDFSLGGSISVDSTTSDGLYQGVFDVTVDY